ncbi:MAG: hypothetical protein ITG04_12305 [Proteiniphilum sp.]|jgi:hypothetical protein|nr:hypothetical protein [Proteiniphilum sp.]
MKKLFTILIVFTTTILFTNCASDKPDDLPGSMNASATQSFTMIAAAGATSTSNVTFAMSDFAAISEYVKYVNVALVQTSSYIQISGITSAQEVELTNVTLSLKSDSKKKIVLPTITANTKLMELPQLTFLQTVMDEINRKGSSSLVLSYTSTHQLSAPVTLTIKMDTRFTFD